MNAYFKDTKQPNVNEDYLTHPSGKVTTSGSNPFYKNTNIIRHSENDNLNFRERKSNPHKFKSHDDSNMFVPDWEVNIYQNNKNYQKDNIQYVTDWEII